MRVLYLTDPQLDYLADQLFTGLWKILGRENVIDYPYKPAYHDPSCKAWYLPQYTTSLFEKNTVLGLLREKAFDLTLGWRAIIARVVNSALKVENDSIIMSCPPDAPRLKRSLASRILLGSINVCLLVLS